MSCHQTVTIGPFLQYASPAKRVDHLALLPTERLTKAFPGRASHIDGDVYLPNVGDVTRIDNEDEDGVIDIGHPLDSREAFRANFAHEIEVLDAAYGTKGAVRFGAVVSWG